MTTLSAKDSWAFWLAIRLQKMSWCRTWNPWKGLTMVCYLIKFSKDFILHTNSSILHFRSQISNPILIMSFLNTRTLSKYKNTSHAYCTWICGKSYYSINKDSFELMHIKCSCRSGYRAWLEIMWALPAQVRILPSTVSFFIFCFFWLLWSLLSVYIWGFQKKIFLEIWWLWRIFLT